jgi:hypothetical protein
MYIICDKTENTGQPYIGENGENCSLEENAVKYEYEQIAREVIEKNNWQEWAVIIEL